MYYSLSTIRYPGRVLYEPGRRLNEADAGLAVQKSPYKARRSDIRSFETAVLSLAQLPFPNATLFAIRYDKTASHNDIIKSLAKSSVNPLSKQVTIATSDTKPVDVGVLVDEYMHMWNHVVGRGHYLKGDAASKHKELNKLIEDKGSTTAIDHEQNMAFHKLEMLNFLSSPCSIPSFMLKAASEHELRIWSQSYTMHLI